MISIMIQISERLDLRNATLQRPVSSDNLTNLTNLTEFLSYYPSRHTPKIYCICSRDPFMLSRSRLCDFKPNIK